MLWAHGVYAGKTERVSLQPWDNLLLARPLTKLTANTPT